MTYYGIRTGRLLGVFYRWDRVKELTNHFPGQDQKGFATFEEAYRFVFGQACDGGDYVEVLHPDGWVARVAPEGDLSAELALQAPVPAEEFPDRLPNGITIQYEGEMRGILLDAELEETFFEISLLPLKPFRPW